MSIEIILNQQHLAIETLACSELPDFAVLTGRNGAGKTQLLQALLSGHAVVQGISPHEIDSYDMASFRIPNNVAGNRQANQFARTTAYDYLEGDRGPPPIAIAAKIFEHHTARIEQENGANERDEFVRNLHERINRTPDFNVFPTAPAPGSDSYDQSLHERVMGRMAQRRASRRTKTQSRVNSFNENPAALLSMAMKRAGKLPHELTREDILGASHYEGAPIANAISEVFAAYKIDQYSWTYARYVSDVAAVRYSDDLVEYQQRNPPPWDTLRDVLARMRDAAGDSGLFDFEFSDPADIRLCLSNYERFSFKTEMTNRTTGAQYEPESLSSGEKILMALCLASFNQRLGRRRPRLLLLDEIDVVLHPSMVTALVEALKELFVEHGSSVLLTTHSPMTVAAFAETEVFRVVRKGREVRVARTTKAEAIEELSEGIATVDAGLRIATYGDADVTILTEGHNARHLKRWVELNFPQGVHVFDQLSQYTNNSQLLAYGRLLGRMNPDTHFVIVWDCDARQQAQTLGEELPVGAKVTPFAFKRRSDTTIARCGIENSYDDDILAHYVINKTDSNGRLLGREFNASRKTEFADHVQRHGTCEYFSHFGELHTVVAELLRSDSGPGDRDGS